jgi:hypothetical protein
MTTRKENRNMHALIIREPWIGMILSGRKTWEMRSRSTRIRGRIGLIRKGSGLVVGVADIVGCLPPLGAEEFASARDRHGVPAEMDEAVLAAGWCIPWVLENVRRLEASVLAGQRSGQVTWVPLAPDVAERVSSACRQSTPSTEGELA